MMRILALGGSGSMGRVAVRVAAGLAGVREIVVADRDLDAAHRLVKELGGLPARLSARQVDVTDADGLAAALEGADVVLNTVGPYYRFGPAVLRAAILARTHYLDICDDWEPTLEMLELDGQARAAGVRAVIGMGASPGISNLLAARAVAELDTVTDLYTAWPVDVPGSGAEQTELNGPDGRPIAAAVHWMQQISGTVAVVSGGQVVQRPPMRPVTLDLPGGRKGTAYTVGHPEPVTLARSYVLTGESASLMVVTPGTAAYLDVLRTDLDEGRLTNESAAAALAKPATRRAMRAAVRAFGFKAPGSLPAFFAAAIGTADGRPRTVLAHLAGAETLMMGMDEATGLPAALGLAQLLDVERVPPGVHPPETAIDGERFFADLAGHAGSVRVIVE
ncbi:saccharopine dehydrogenase family protein [Nonomuraea sp. NPDC050540]|uniref:saccharopine dehydrogenase family protein n=1 Tax=Nonomuraea sp. NPDC050540 TaxID=3364367 RepID=UPI0037A03EEB